MQTIVKEVPIIQVLKKMNYTIKDIYALPDGERAELIDGELYMMSPPGRIHQKLVSELHAQIHAYIKSLHGDCEVYPAPFAVFLNADSHTYVEPDLSVICDKSKLDDRGCNGAPDWVIEIVSPSSQRMDYMTKLFKYRDAGVQEYWVVNPEKETVLTYFFEGENGSIQFDFTDDVPVRIYEGWSISIAELLK